MKFFVILCFILSIFSFAFAQNSLPELEIAKEIKLLKSTRTDVTMIMSEFDRDEEEGEDDERYYQEFRSDNAKVLVSYSRGDCSEDAGIRSQPEWNVTKMTATKVVITFKETTKLKDLGLNLSNFKKKLENDEIEDSEEYIYYNEKAGIIILTDEGEVEKIILHPPKKRIGSLCHNENNEEMLSREVSFVDSIVQKDTYCILVNRFADVTNLELQTKGVFGCQNENCSDAKKEISIVTTALDPENDVLTYDYTVTGGTIVGVGAQVVWDLGGTLPGIYQITAGVDDSCGICGQTKARKILVKENSYEVIPPAKITELILDKTELNVTCPVGPLKRKFCPTGNCSVSVSAIAEVTEDKNVTFEYRVSGGKIIGSGSNVVWDLAGLPPGEYSVSIAASDDNTIFGTTKTAIVKIEESPYCSATLK